MRRVAWLVLCLPLAALAAPGHRDAILRLASISAALVEEAREREAKGVLGIDRQSRMPPGECTQFFQDIISMKNIEVVSEGAATWQALGAAGALPNLDPDFKQWRDGDARHLAGYLVVRWQGKRELMLRVRRSCADDEVKCASLAFQQLEVHERAGPGMACSVQSVGAREGLDWQGKLTPMLLDFPGASRTPRPPQVFPVDLLRAPPAQPLAPR